MIDICANCFIRRCLVFWILVSCLQKIVFLFGQFSYPLFNSWPFFITSLFQSNAGLNLFCKANYYLKYYRFTSDATIYIFEHQGNFLKTVCCLLFEGKISLPALFSNSVKIQLHLQKQWNPQWISRTRFSFKRRHITQIQLP